MKPGMAFLCVLFVVMGTINLVTGNFILGVALGVMGFGFGLAATKSIEK